MAKQRVRAWAVLAAAMLVGTATSTEAAEPDVVAGEVLREGPRLRAGSSGATYAFPGGTSVEFSPGAEFQLGPTMPLQLGPSGSVPSRTFLMRSGLAEVRVRRGGTAVRVQVQAGVATIVHYGSSTVAARSGRMLLAARSGRTLFSHGKAWRELPAGSRKVFSHEHPDGQKVEALAAVSVSSPRPQLLTGSARSGQKVTWQAVPGAERYRVELWRDGRLLQQEETVETSFRPRLQVGQYELRVSALDAWGLPGAPHPPIPLRAIGVRLPTGASLRWDGRIALFPGQKIELRGHEGMQVTYGRLSTFFGDAPARMGLSAGRAVYVRLREHEGAQELAFELIPNEVSADVRIGPSSATWPADRLLVSVKLRDPAGLSEKYRPVPVVSVDGRRLKLRFQRKGDRMWAYIPRPGFRGKDHGGPWVVRAEVRDPGGRTLGRDFLEVAPSTKKRERRAASAGKRSAF
ncbi:MAG: hypothetical protein KC766_11225 [Myxococcales bacterium]|nr:hypothetical protein [Myxococcales bacterium]